MKRRTPNTPETKITELQRFVEFEHHFPDVRKMVPCWTATDRFVGVNKMVPALSPENPETINHQPRELEARIAENVAEVIENA